jgi:hypothetical protein
MKRFTEGASVREARKAAFKASRRDAPVVCASCGRQVRRRGRLQRYCSTRCRKRSSCEAICGMTI